ncbi:hypothetical protein KP509_07G069600 [Ceratopteris richardii]|uniref:VQ domain-containing protein n=1 Tax=Ceratopteris richardii TaxID=49495 RepID=A0A8T2UJA6_CERRI|nr:hypothetical protein KP509_07G069600 [Ceratopteris richardii]
MKSTHAVECIGANDNVGGMSQTAIADATSPSSSSPASGLERKRRSPPSDLSPNKRLSRQERRREEEPSYAAPPVFTRILADKSNFKDIVHHFTGIRTSSMRPLFHRSKKPATSQILESTCSCQCYKDGHWCADKAVLYTVCQRMRVLTCFFVKAALPQRTADP